MRGVGDVVTRGVRVNGGGHRFQIVRSDGSEEIALRMPGRHNVQNALAAAAAATVLGVRLADIRRPSRRSSRSPCGEKWSVFPAGR